MPFPPAREVILEDFIAGRELTVEGYVSGDRVTILNFSEKQTAANFIVVGHLIPAMLSPAEQDQLTATGEQCARALGIRNTVFHAEVHIREGLPYVIECAARPPGLHTVEMIQRCYGYDLTEISIELAAGRCVSTPRTNAQRHAAILALYSTERGVLERVDGLEELESRGGVFRVKVDAEKGSRINPLTTFWDVYGFVVLEDATPEGLRAKARWAREHLRLVLS
jgi:biotin carboxylase